MVSEIQRLVRVVARQGCLETLTQAMLEVQRKSQAEPGCLHYEFLQDIASPDTLYISEKYADKEAFKSHARSEHMRTYLETTKDLVAVVMLRKVRPLTAV